MTRRDRFAVLSALAALTLLSWAYLVWMAGSMDGMAMGGASMDGMSMDGASMDGMPMHGGSTDAGSTMGAMQSVALRPWSAVDFAGMLAMWVIMMVGMMVPSATPMVLVYTQVARKAARDGSPLPSALIFVGGYVVAWSLFSVVATILQWGLERLAVLSPMMVTTSPALGLAILIGAAAYQLSPWKDACLRHCRSPAEFFAEHFRPGASGAFRLGVSHGLYCLGCCWVLMALLFVGGVMNLLWIAALTLFVLLEKALPFETFQLRFAGAVLLLATAAVFAARTLGHA